MRTVTAAELAKRMLDLLGAGEGETLALSKLRNGAVLLEKAEAMEAART